ncbi:MAG: hypothetical protein LR015_10510 [Verrucomicrobia bacterium]|nr:hypothetical protein [Verrucomicrobiota bacterium]
MGAVTASALLGFSALSAQTPTNNPILAHYGPGEYPKWIDSISWDRVINMAEYTNGANHFERFENARDELHALGGGVLYYPAGEYFFDLPDMGFGPGIGPMSRGLMLKSGVVIRGADLPGDANQAVVRPTQDAQHPDFANNVTHNLNPQTVFRFPTHMRGTDPITGVANSAGEVPSHWSFIGMTTGNGEETIADVHNIGVVNVTLEGGTIYWGYHTPRAERMREGFWFGNVWKNTPEGAPDEETWSGHRPTGEHYMHGIHGSASWHSEMTAGSGRLVKGVRINNGAPWNDMFYANRQAPGVTPMNNDTFAHYRFTGRIAAHGSNIFVANNVIAKPTKNFIHRMLQNPRSEAGNHERLVLFDYSNHIGVDINKSNFGGNQNHPSAVIPGGGYYFDNVIVRDNWVFNRGNKNFEISGQWVVLYNNHAEKFEIGRTFPFDYVTNPLAVPGSTLATGVTMQGVSFDGWDYQHQTTASDYMNRGYDMGGRNVWVHRTTLVNSGSIGNDGEGVMSQEHNRIGNFSWAFTDIMHGRANKGPGTFGEPGWHGTWNMQQFGLLLLRAWSHGSVGVFGAERASSPDTGLNWVLDVSVVGGNPGPGGVASISGAGPGPNPPVDYITTDHFNPVSAPANVAAEIREDGAVHLSWEDTANNELGFRVERRVDGGDWRVIAYRPMSNLGRTIDPSITDPLDAILPVEQRTPIYRLNPQAWVDFTAPVAHADAIEYRVVAINSADDLSTGVSEVVELELGSSVLEPVDSVMIAVSATGVIVTLPESVQGQWYQLEMSNNLQSGSWTSVGEAVQGTGTELSLEHEGAVSSEDAKFYRIRTFR